jgi:hypothetical protein
LRDTHLYSNIDHLNTAGITVFAQKYMKRLTEYKNSLYNFSGTNYL